MEEASKQHKDQNRNEGNEEESAKENEEGAGKAVNEQPAASPEMTAPPTDIATNA